MTAPVVAGVDGTALGRSAALWAGRYADALGLPMLVAHAGDLPTENDGGDTYDIGDGTAIETVSWLRRQGVTCQIDAVVRDTSPESLLDELSGRAAVVVVGDSGDGLVGSLIRGSVGHYVAGHARSPVVLVPPSWAEGRTPEHPTITVGVSSSEGGRRALDFALRTAVALNADLRAVRCWDENFAGYGNDLEAEQHLQSMVVRGLVAHALRRCGLPGHAVDVQYDVRPGPVVNALRDAATGADLLVLGTRFRSGVPSRLGHTASRLSRQMSCPVAVVGPAPYHSGEPVREKTGERQDSR